MIHRSQDDHDTHHTSERIRQGMRYDIVLHENGIVEIEVSQNAEPVQLIRMEFMAFKSINYALDDMIAKMVADPGCYDGVVEPDDD